MNSLLLQDQFGTEEMRQIFSDESMIQRWLDVESALAHVQAELGIIPVRAAEEIGLRARSELVDLQELRKDMDKTAHPIVPLLRVIKNLCQDGAGEYVHWGATTQDIVDTGTILQIREALAVVKASLDDLEKILVLLARQHRGTIMAGRTHGQQALPITFGYKVAVWIVELRRNQERLAQLSPRLLVGQFGGAVGNLSALAEKGPELQKILFQKLGLGCPEIAWHVARDNFAELASFLGLLTGSVGRIVQEIYLLQKTEVAELEEPFSFGKVGSSTMPHKRNPSGCETVLALVRLVRSIVPLALEGVLAEHERDKVVLQTEREYLPRIFALSHAVVAKTSRLVSGLTVNSGHMENNLGLLKGLLLSESVMMALGQKIGRQKAHEIVYRISMAVFEKESDFKQALVAEPEVSVHLTAEEIEELLEPERYLGLSAHFVDRVTGER